VAKAVLPQRYSAIPEAQPRAAKRPGSSTGRSQVASELPGRGGVQCSVPHSHAAAKNTVNQRRPGWGAHVADYAPLVIVIGLAMLAATAKQVAYPGPWTGADWMLDVMGFFLTIFAMFKLFDLSAFADGFQMYDLLAKRARPYALVYPFIELGLGLAYLARWHLTAVYTATVVVMLFGALGVGDALRRKLDVECACLGTVLRVPLSTVALTEDLGMAAMAVVMLAR
jgi:hypothetical protein